MSDSKKNHIWIGNATENVFKNACPTNEFNLSPPYVIVLVSSEKTLEGKAIEFHRILLDWIEVCFVINEVSVRCMEQQRLILYISQPGTLETEEEKGRSQQMAIVQ